MRLIFDGEVWFWKGPSPFYFITVPDQESSELRDVANLVSYGWGVVPVTATIRTTRWATSLIPKDGAYLVPLKSSVRKNEDIQLGDNVHVKLTMNNTRS
ncbi:MAG: DUF1905 domain-containing protein [Acidimicrobiales bacterium]